VITTEANGAVGTIHDRMPVLLPQEAWTRWLDPALPDVSELMPLLRPAPDDVLALIPVSTRVNSVRNDGPDLMEPVTPGAAEAPATSRRRGRPDEPGTPGQGTLFG
jgi:putative SOS response-associated peptidase YedK